MADKNYKVRIQLAYDTEDNWKAIENIYVPHAGEIVLIKGETGVRIKCGDGTSTLAVLPFQDEHILDLIQGLEQALDNKVDNTFTINGQPLTGTGITVEAEGSGIDGITINGTKSDTFTLNAASVGAVPTSRTVNGKALSSNISLTASDVSALPSSTTYVKTVNGSSGSVTIATGNSIVLQSSKPTGQKKGDLWLKQL